MIDLPPPYALGLPSHFTEWRPGQEYGLTLILDAPTRFVAINAPTGFGKSLDYMAAGVLHGGRTVVLTANKNLMDQLNGEYHSLHRRRARRASVGSGSSSWAPETAPQRTANAAQRPREPPPWRQAASGNILGTAPAPVTTAPATPVCLAR